MPREVPLSKVPDGAVLAADVFDGHGNVLLSQGTRLTRAHVQLIERRGIRSVLVVGDDEPAPLAAPAAAEAAPAGRLPREEVLARHAAAFSRVGGAGLAEAVRRTSRAHLEAGNLPPG